MRWYHKVVLGISMVLMLLLIVFFGFKIEHIDVEGTECYSSQEIIDSIFTRKFSDNELVFMFYQKFYGLNKLPFVEDIEVTYDNRNSITLHVYDKTISGCIQYMGQYVYFDKDGTVLQSLAEKKEGVPVVTGIKFGEFTVGQPFSVEDDSMFATIMNLSSLIGHYNIEVKKIHLAAGEVIIYSGKIKIRLRNKAMYDDEIAALSSILEIAKEKNLSGVIDMRAFEKGNKVSLQKEKKEKKKTKKEEDQKKEGDAEGGEGEEKTIEEQSLEEGEEMEEQSVKEEEDTEQKETVEE